MKIIIPDKVSKTATEIFTEAQFMVVQKPGIDITECNRLSKNAAAVIVRSYNLHELSLHRNLKTIGRAGAGVNNIPVDTCTERGIVVFNTPGANANGVAELVLCGMLLSSRKIIDGIIWTETIKETGNEVPKLIEKNKNNFKGVELKGKNFGVIGLGPIGIRTANCASCLGMNVSGYTRTFSPDKLEKLAKDVCMEKDLDTLLKTSDFISLHIPINESTQGFLNNEKFTRMKSGVKIMNFSRNELVNTDDLLGALESGIVDRYVTDFPVSDLIGVKGVFCIPHLGASTSEAEESCAEMVAYQIIDYLKNGNIKNSVNFPECSLEKQGNQRLTITAENNPALTEKIMDVLSTDTLIINKMVKAGRGAIAYSIVDINGSINNRIVDKIDAIRGVIRTRKL